MICVREVMSGNMCGSRAGRCDRERQRPPISFPSIVQLSFLFSLCKLFVTEELIKTATYTNVQLCSNSTSVPFVFACCLKAVIQQTNSCFSAAHPRQLTYGPGKDSSSHLHLHTHNLVFKVLPRELSQVTEKIKTREFSGLLFNFT